MNNFFRKIISKLSKYSIIYENAFDLLKVIKFHDIDVVLDVGASWGGYAKTLRRFGFKNKVFKNSDFIHNNAFYIGNNQFLNKTRLDNLHRLLTKFFN